jgi:NAD(P)-dependent dehydrogenase (short-subunit alcohol dehydrogenase family)
MTSLFSLNGKTAVVTGAGGLLGKEHCLALSEAGANVVLADINIEAAQQIHRQLPGRHISVQIDVTDKASLETARDIILNRLGSIDILINNAAINDMFEKPELSCEQSSFELFPLENWHRMLEVNVTGSFLACQVFGTVMAQVRKGSIINIASTYGMVGPDQSIYRNRNGEQVFFKGPAYPTTKGAILAFTRYLAAYWGRQGVRVNCLSPGGVENGQDEHFISNYSAKTPVGRMAVPSDYRGAIIFLASDASSYMTGANLVVDGGWTAV